MIKELLEMQKVILGKLSEIQEKQASSEAKLGQMNTRFSPIEESFKEFHVVNSTLYKVEVCLHEHDRNLDAVNRKVDELGNRSRRNNLIIRGVGEDGRETDYVLLKKVNDDVFTGILKLKINSIERIHRLGKNIEVREEPIILRVADFRDKSKILRHCSLLNGTNISISEDYSKRIVEVWKCLWVSTQEERSQGAKVNLLYDKVKINNDLYAWNAITKERYECQARPHNDPA